MAEPTPAKKSSPAEKKVLVVDDDDNILMLMKTTLEIEGFQARTGRDGRNILQAALQYKPDLILTDLMMPGGGGYELLRSLQSDPVTRKIPVIIMTGSHLDKTTQALMRQESNLAGYYEKPVRPDVLMKHVHKLLNTLSRDEERKQFTKENPVNFDDVL